MSYATSSFVALREKELKKEAPTWLGKVVQTISDKDENV